MKCFGRNRISNVALFAGVVAAAWSPGSFACSDTPVLASICVMAVPVAFGPFNGQFVAAAGQDLSFNNDLALYSLISGGTVSITVPGSSATATVTGGAGMPGVVGGTATVSGNTNTIGTGAAIDIRPAYIALTYYIAAQNGLYEPRLGLSRADACVRHWSCCSG